jgi:serine/threonine protein phosphatase PrpC
MKKQLTVAIGQHSSRGQKSVNQDFHGAFIPKEPLLSSKGIAVAIADGISSSDVSQVASETVIKSFLLDYYCTSEAWSVKKSGQCILKAINSWLHTQTQQSPYRFNKDKGYVCTFSAVVFKSNTAHLFHSGDSRIFRVNGRHLEQLTTDHRREVSADVSYLTRALGIHDYLEIDYSQVQISEGDIFILATDGVYEHLLEGAIIETIEASKDNLDLAAERLVDDAFAAGSSDNLTLQILEITGLPEKSLNEVQEQINALPLPPKLQPRKEFDGYQVIREIYISSRSHVYLAKDVSSGEEVVIKTPSTEMRSNQAYLESFLMEHWIAGRINNAHVLKTVEEKRKRNYLYIVTEFVKGKTLAQWMHDNPAPDIDTVRAIVEQIAKGLQAFHRQEMVHQDLRPNNIMIDETGTVKIIDFGATKVAGVSEISPTNEGIVGTAQYTAPEYFIGEVGTKQSDLFSLGVLTYQMLSGRLPYGTAVAKTQTTREQLRLSYQPLVVDTVPSWVDYAIGVAVDINPLKRYDEISEFVHDLKQPNPRYVKQARPPLLERDPILFWQGVCFILFSIIVYQNIN